MTLTIDCPSAKCRSPIGEHADAMAQRRLRCADGVAELESRARAYAHLNPIAWVDWSAVATQAAAIDADPRLSGGPLAGIAVSIKDLYLVDGMPTRAGTRARLPALGEHEATLVSRLRAAGALIFAKTNMHEIALGATGENDWTGDVCNPVDPRRQAGGSSSGAAVCVATGIGLAGIGSDTGGSVRIPASFCGVTGFKPSFGAVPLDGALHLSWTCDHPGPLARTVDDCARLHAVMSAAGFTDTSMPARAPRFGVPAAWLRGRLADGVRDAFEQSCSRLRLAGVDLVDLALPELPRAWECYSPIVRAEAAFVHRDVLRAGGEGFSASVLAPMRLGEQLRALDYLDALRIRELVKRDLAAGLAAVDALILPSSAIVAPLRGTETVAVEGGMLSVREAVLGQTLPFSLCGLPALSMPWVRIDGLPVGMQLVGAHGEDSRILAIGRWLEAQFAGWLDERA